MKLNIVPIGNSKGVRLPKAILAQCRFQKYVDLQIVKNHLVIKPYPASPRKKWEESFIKMHKEADDKLLINDSLELDTTDWSW